MKLCPVLRIFRPMWIKFGVEDKMISWMCDARKSAQWKPGLNLLAYRDFCPSLAHLLYDFGRNVTKQVRSRSYWAFVSFMKMYAENTFTLRMSVYDITLRAYRDTAWNLKVKNALAKSVFCVTRYTIAVFTVFETACRNLTVIKTFKSSSCVLLNTVCMV